MDWLMASMILLWVVVLIFGVLLFALARQVGVILERVSPVGALMSNASLRVGQPAPALTLTTLDGNELAVGVSGTESGASRSMLLLFVGPKCPVCKALLPAARSIAKRESGWMDLVLASDGGTEDAHRRYVARHKLNAIPYVISQSLGRSYGVAKLPHAVLIDERGQIASFGMVNSREHLESLVEAKQRGVKSLQDFLAVRASEDGEQPRAPQAAARSNGRDSHRG